jgi:hypothetical protein
MFIGFTLASIVFPESKIFLFFIKELKENQIFEFGLLVAASYKTS